MICPYCFGKGYFYEKVIVPTICNEDQYDETTCIFDIRNDQYDIQNQCKECQGIGIVHCCDGLIAND
jgi:hypothetical protein